MMRKAFVLVLLLSSLSAFAQRDRVYLKNGSLLRGELLEVGAAGLSIDIGEVDALSLSLNNLRAVRVKKRKSNLSTASFLALDSLNRALRMTKWLHQVRVGVLNGEDGRTFNTVTNFSVDYTVLYPVKPTWYVGLGLGYDEYPSFKVMPIGIEIRKDWGIGPAPFFTYFKVGISRAGARDEVWGLQGTVKGQEFIAFGIGQQWSVGRHAMFMSFGFRNQSLRTSWVNGDFRSSTDWNLNRVDWKVGFVF